MNETDGGGQNGAKDAGKDGGQDGGRRAKLRNAGLAFGIGSAAITAALLYASKGKKTPGK